MPIIEEEAMFDSWASDNDCVRVVFYRYLENDTSGPVKQLVLLVDWGGNSPWEIIKKQDIGPELRSSIDSYVCLFKNLFLTQCRKLECLGLVKMHKGE